MMMKKRKSEKLNKWQNGGGEEPKNVPSPFHVVILFERIELRVAGGEKNSFVPCWLNGVEWSNKKGFSSLAFMPKLFSYSFYYAAMCHEYETTESTAPTNERTFEGNKFILSIFIFC